MNRYAMTAQTYYQEFLPTRYSQIEDPTSYFQELGEQIQSQVVELTPQIAGADLPGEGHLEKTGRLNAARRQAEEIVLKELVYSQAPENEPKDAGQRTRPSVDLPVVVRQLTTVPLFDGLPATDVEQLAGLMEPVSVAAADYVLREGEETQELYVIVEGTAGVYERQPAGHMRRVAQLKAGDFFGELGLLNAQPRTADVRCEAPLSLLRLSRPNYLSLVAVNSELHARVTASGAERAGASLARWMPHSHGHSDALPFDLLLHRLIDHEIDTMRAAEIRGDEITFEEVVGFYGATRFLYPAKLGFLESRFDAVKATWERLIAANNDVFKILMLRRVVDEQLAVKNSICAFEYAPGTWQVQHLVSADRHELSGTLAALIGILDWVHGRTDVKAVRFTYRPSNPGVNRLFHGLATALGNTRILETVSDYHVQAIPSPRAWTEQDWGVTVRYVSAADVENLAELYGDEHAELPGWLGLDDPDFVGLDAKYTARKLRRSRQILVAERPGEICGAVTCDFSSEGINFSFLENAIDNLVLSPTLPADLRASVVHSLLAGAVNEYHERGRRYVVALLNEHLAELVEATGVLSPPDKNYAVVTFDAGEIPAVQLHFKNYYTQMLRDRSFGDNGSSSGDRR